MTTPNQSAARWAAVLFVVLTLIAVGAPHLAVRVVTVALLVLAALICLVIGREVASRFRRPTSSAFAPRPRRGAVSDEPELLRRMIESTQSAGRSANRPLGPSVVQVIRAEMAGHLRERHGLQLGVTEHAQQIAAVLPPHLAALAVPSRKRRGDQKAVTAADLPQLVAELEQLDRWAAPPPHHV